MVKWSTHRWLAGRGDYWRSKPFELPFSLKSTSAKNKLSRQSANREREPWLLASNLPEDQWNPSKIVAIYKQRMQIEEGFRDVKSEHFGIGITHHRSRCPRRIEVLLLVSALANYIICLTGLQAREAGHEHRFQSNSLKRRSVLSLWRLGLEYWRIGTRMTPRFYVNHSWSLSSRQLHPFSKERRAKSFRFTVRSTREFQIYLHERGFRGDLGRKSFNFAESQEPQAIEVPSRHII